MALQAVGELTRAPTVVEFNPWRYGDSAAITNAFYQELAAALGEADKSLAGRQRAWAFQQYARFFTTASGGLKGAGEPIGATVGWLAGIGFLSAGVGALTSVVPIAKLAPYLLTAAGAFAILGRLFSAFSGAGKPSKPLELVRVDLERKLKKLDRPLVVVIDDIDRLPDRTEARAAGIGRVACSPRA